MDNELRDRLDAWWRAHIGILMGRLRRFAGYADIADAIPTSLEQLWPRLGSEFTVREENGELVVEGGTQAMPLLDFITNRARLRLLDTQRRGQRESTLRQELAREVKTFEPPLLLAPSPAHVAALV